MTTNSKNTQLRAMEPEDLELLYTIENDSEVWDVTSAKAHYSRYAIKQYLAQQPQEISIAGELRLVITTATGEAVGLVDLTSYSPTDRTAEIGITILKSHRGKGHGKEAIEEIERYAKQMLNMRMLYAHTLACNESANKLFTACGYEAVATLPEWQFHMGKYENLMVFKKKL